jgi:hypothetical protein
MGNKFVEGRSAEKARSLLKAAEDQGIDPSLVRTTYNGYFVPEDLTVEGAEDKQESEVLTKEKTQEGSDTQATAVADENSVASATEGQATGSPVVDFDPSGKSVAEVNDYLATADADEYDRVIAAEKAGKGRKGILEVDN